MKKFMKVMAFVLVAAMMLSLAACGKKVEDSSSDYADSSENQQRWLKTPDSNLVINPDFVSGTSSESEKQALNLGITDDSGNVSKSFNDLLFLLEDRSANGVGGVEYWSADFSASSELWMGMADLDANNSRNDALDIVVNDEKKRLHGEGDEFDLDENNLTLVVDVKQCDAPFTIRLRTTGPAVEVPMGTINSPGTYTYSLRSYLRSGTSQNISYGTRLVSFDFDFSSGGSYKFNSFKLMDLDSGLQRADAKVSSTWAPYAISSELAFPNGTTMKTEDFFYGANTVDRKISCTKNGIIALAGKVYGTAAFDEGENMISMESGDGNIAIISKRKGTLMFYKTEEEMLSGVNGSEDPADAAFWVMQIGDVNAPNEEAEVEGDVFYVSVSLDPSKSVEELRKLSYDGVSSKGERIYSDLPAYWTGLLSEKNISDYITAIGK